LIVSMASDISAHSLDRERGRPTGIPGSLYWTRGKGVNSSVSAGKWGQESD
jgi:hypothetical protein